MMPVGSALGVHGLLYMLPVGSAFGVDNLMGHLEHMVEVVVEDCCHGSDQVVVSEACYPGSGQVEGR